MLNATEMYTFTAIVCYVSFAPMGKKADSWPHTPDSRIRISRAGAWENEFIFIMILQVISSLDWSLWSTDVAHFSFYNA